MSSMICFVRRVARCYPLGGKQVIELLSGQLRPRMVSVLKTCKQHYKTGCITNNVKTGTAPGTPRDQARAKAMQAVMDIFDVIVESSVEGIRKPNPEIYRMACARMGVEPSQSVFIDDLGINLKPARAMGMTTVRVLNETQAIEELSSITGIDFP